jgi:hypothetical protein
MWQEAVQEATNAGLWRKRTMEMKEYTLGEGKLIYIPRWADDPVMLYREAKKMPFTPEIVTMFQRSTVIERQTVDFGLPYSSLLSKFGFERRG